MKTILFIRHAKSGWDSPTSKDHDRPLEERGLKDAPVMAKRLLDKGIKIEAFVSSTAVRAYTTASLFHETYKAKKEQLIEVESLYHPEVPAFYETIKGFDDSWKSVAIFSHNPGITEMVNTLRVARVDDMPTCGIFGVQVDIDSWKDFKTGAKQFLLFDYPKAAL